MTLENKNGLQLPCPAHELIMHRPPMLLIDSLVKRQGDSASASATINKKSICYHDTRGILAEYYIEIAAQSMAAANGFDALKENSRPKDGFIVGIDTCTIHHEITGEATFLITIVKTMEFSAMKVMEGEVFTDGVKVASIAMKVWEQPNDEQ